MNKNENEFNSKEFNEDCRQAEETISSVMSELHTKYPCVVFDFIEDRTNGILGDVIIKYKLSALIIT